MNMTHNWYVRYSDSKKAEKVSFREYCDLHKMGIFYNAVIGDNFHPHGKTLTLNFPKSFV